MLLLHFKFYYHYKKIGFGLDSVTHVYPVCIKSLTRLLSEPFSSTLYTTLPNFEATLKIYKKSNFD